MRTFLIIAAIFIGGFILWVINDNEDLKDCQARYGQSYTLWYSSANSSVKACQGPDGTLKEL